MPPQVTLTFSRTELSAADHSSGGEGGTCTRDDEDIAPLDTVVAPFIAAELSERAPGREHRDEADHGLPATGAHTTASHTARRGAT